MAGKTFRSAITGHFVTPEFALEHPDTTVAEDDITSEHSDTLSDLADRIDKVREWVSEHFYTEDDYVVHPADVIALLDAVDPQWREAIPNPTLPTPQEEE